MSTLIDQARAFADEDPDPESRDELRALVARAQAPDAAALAELADRFSAPLEFGTAGLRGRVEAGLARMNRVVVIKAAHGLGTSLLARSPNHGPDARKAGVLIGFDGRYSSRQFAEDTAAVLAGLGIPAHLFPDPVPTPLCAFATVHVGAAAGVMVTASHNPPKDNGYKVYRADGAQIIPPEDQEIAARIAAAPRVDQITRVAPPDAALSGLRRIVDDSVELAYLEGIRRAVLHPPEATPLRIVYTAMHGVGHRLASRVFRQAGFEGIADVAAQADADGAFRTVAFPNPEEKGAMDRSLALAQEIKAELILANDPDADRLGAAVLDPATGSYRMLSGNEIGILLADDALAHADTKGKPKLVATSLVSSTLLSRMARDRGAVYAETLTGFKWIADAARKGEAAGQAFVFGYEEALGYTVGPLVRDKDGIGAAVRLADLARFLKGRGVSLLGRIDEILVAHGMSHEMQWSVTLSDAAGKKRIAAAMEALRADPPKALGESPVHRVLDLSAGEERAGGVTKPLSYPRSNVLVFYSEDGARLTVRPSGTEPKIKFYVELVAAVKTPADVAPARVRLEARCGEIKAALNQRLGFT
jgi:phosphomannomutase